MIMIIAAWVLTVLLFVFMVYYSNMMYLIKAASLPMLLLFSGAVTVHYVDNLGAPIKRPIPLEFEYIHHKIAGESILVWIYTEERGERLYEIPYDRETAKAMEEAKEGTEEGERKRMKGRPESNENGTQQTVWQVEDATPEGELGETK